jgi:transcription antitermination factor NusG
MNSCEDSINDELIYLKKRLTKSWFAVYTRSRAEKKVFQRLQDEHIKSFLPLQKTIRQWSDRKKKVEIPLLKSYVFVHVSLSDFNIVLKTDGVVRFVAFEGQAAPIPQKQIDNLKLLANSDAEIEKTKKIFKSGQRVKIISGPLKDLTGELIDHGQKKRFLVRVDHIKQNLLVNIPASLIHNEN